MNNIYLGDCLEVMNRIPDKSIHLILADIPYGVTACPWDSVIPLAPMWKHLKRISKDRGAIVLTASQPFTTTLISSNMKMFKYCWVWDKVKPANFATAKYGPLRSTEDIVVFGTGRINYYPIMTLREKIKIRTIFTASDSAPLAHHDGKARKYTHRYPKNLIRISNANQRNRIHPTQKPVLLMQYLIKTYTKENEIVLDFCCGSGTTGAACQKINRQFILIEKNTNYFNLAKERLAK